MLYPIHEVFHSLKGEGLWTGLPMSFIRLAGCSVNCSFCDTDHTKTRDVAPIKLVSELWYQHVVITGGEPCDQDLTPLLEELKISNHRIHLETSGVGTFSNQPWSLFDHIALSPKPKNAHVVESLLPYVSEVKFLVGPPDWQSHITSFLSHYKKHLSKSCRLFVMPLAKSKNHPEHREQGGLEASNITAAIYYAKINPSFSVCMQLHKVWGIP